MAYFLGILIFIMPIAVLVGFRSKCAAAHSPRGWTWLKIACQAVLLSACLIGLIVALDVFRSGQDMLGLTLLFLPISAMGALICAGAMVGNLVGMPPRSWRTNARR